MALVICNVKVSATPNGLAITTGTAGTTYYLSAIVRNGTSCTNNNTTLSGKIVTIYTIPTGRSRKDLGTFTSSSVGFGEISYVFQVASQEHKIYAEITGTGGGTSLPYTFTIVPVVATHYKCTSGTCAEDSTGTYTSLDTCNSDRKYAIIDGTCTLVCPDYTGTKYDTLDLCTAANTPPVSTSNTLIYMLAIIAIIFIAIYFVFVS